MTSTKKVKEKIETSQQFKTVSFGKSSVILADGTKWLNSLPENTLHAIVTDPPYGVKEYDLDQIEKMKIGKGGMWRLPPNFDGSIRSPLPRFTALNKKERERISEFFTTWAEAAFKALRPGGHIFIATNSFIAPLIYDALSKGGLEFRGQLMRTVHTLRGGDRPKNAEKEFPHVSAIPRGRYEPWGIFRKPLGEMTIAECLRKYQTGGIRRRPDGNPFEDLIYSGRTPTAEKEIANHPSLKPQAFLRKIVYASLPLGEGVVADPFMGSGSTIAAAEALGLKSIGVEINPEYFELAVKAIPNLAAIQLPEENLEEPAL
jgi:site-specific DNA-methyltransferase (adenine-specific)